MTLTDMYDRTLLPPGHPWGQSIIHLDTVESTNTYAKNLAEKGAPHGTVVIAHRQTGGRGRLGRSFSSPAGLGLYLSVILRPQCAPQALMHLTCAMGVAATEAVEAACGLRPGIKWTNDLVVGQKKLGGILTELRTDPHTQQISYAIVGIGINCLQTEADFPPDVGPIATSLLESGHPLPPQALGAAVIDGLYRMDERLLTEKEAILAAFAARCVTLGKDISICRGDQIRHARALAIDGDGGLIVQFPDGHRETVSAGEVSIRGMYGYL